MTAREHFMSDFGAVVRDPVLVVSNPARCRRGESLTQGVRAPSCNGTLGQIDNGKASCTKCGLVHGFMRIKGEVRYGVCL